MYVLRIFGELAKTPRMSEINISNGIIPITLNILTKRAKFKKEVQIWALVILNRGCYHRQQDIASRIMQTCI